MLANPFIRIKSLREHKDWTQSDLARESGVDQANISRIEAGKTPNASGVLLGQLANALETTVDYLLGLTDDPTAPPNASTLSAIEQAARDPFFQQIAFCWPALTYKDREAIAYTTNKFKMKRQRENQE